MDNDRNKPEGTGGYDSPHKDEYDRMVERIKAKRKALSKSIWTDEPLLKPYKSIWLDDDEDEDDTPKQEPEQPQRVSQSEPQSRPEPQPQPEPEPEPPKPDPFNVTTPEYFEPNPVIRDARKEQLAFGVTPENYDEVIMPFVNEYSVERKLPDQRKNLSLKPKANAAVSYAAQRELQISEKRDPQPQKQPEQPIMHKLRHERFFDDEGEPLRRHDPEKSTRKRPKIVPLSQRSEQEDLLESLTDKQDSEPEPEKTNPETDTQDNETDTDV